MEKTVSVVSMHTMVIRMIHDILDCCVRAVLVLSAKNGLRKIVSVLNWAIGGSNFDPTEGIWHGQRSMQTKRFWLSWNSFYTCDDSNSVARTHENGIGNIAHGKWSKTSTFLHNFNLFHILLSAIFFLQPKLFAFLFFSKN